MKPPCPVSGPFKEPHIGPVETYVRALLPIANSPRRAPPAPVNPAAFRAYENHGGSSGYFAHRLIRSGSITFGRT
jgi:hypothetical protein